VGALILGAAVGIGIGVFFAWGAAQARIREMEWKQDQERLAWQTLTRWQLESQRMGYGIGEAGAVTTDTTVLPIARQRTRGESA